MTDPSAPTPGPEAGELLDLASAWVDGALSGDEFVRASAAPEVSALAETFAGLRRALAAQAGPVPSSAQRDAHIARALAAWDTADRSEAPDAEVVSLAAARERRIHRLGRVAAGVAAAAVVALGVVAVANHGSRRTEVTSARAESVGTVESVGSPARVNVAGAPAAAVTSTIEFAKAESTASDASVGAAPAAEDGSPSPWSASTDAEVVALVQTFDLRPPAAPAAACPGRSGSPVAAVAWRNHAAQLYVVGGTDKSSSRQAVLVDSVTCAVLISVALPAA